MKFGGRKAGGQARYFRSRSYEEVALEFGIPTGTVKSRVYYALKALRLALEELGWNGDE